MKIKFYKVESSEKYKIIKITDTLDRLRMNSLPPIIFDLKIYINNM